MTALTAVAIDASSVVPVVVALAGGGAVAFYTARPRKDSIIADAADKAIGVVGKAIDRQAQDLVKLDGELSHARERIAVLEAELQRTTTATAEALRTSSEATAQALRVSSDATAQALRVADEQRVLFEGRIDALRMEVTKLGGDVEKINHIGKQGPRGPKGPPGDPGDPGTVRDA